MSIGQIEITLGDPKSNLALGLIRHTKDKVRGMRLPGQ
jgi:hypothetical protein